MGLVEKIAPISFTPAPVPASATSSPYNSPLGGSAASLPRRAIDRNFISVSFFPGLI